MPTPPVADVLPASVTSPLVDTVGAAEYLGLSLSALTHMRTAGEGPRYVRLGRAIRYRVADLDKYIAANVTGGAR